MNSGIEKEKICLDGGIGFAKNREQNIELLNGYDRLYTLGYPLLLGASRKSLFGGLPENRLEQTVESSRLAARKKVLFVRVHDVYENAEAIRKVYGTKVKIQGLEISACHGVHAEEKVNPQPFVFDIEVHCDFEKIGKATIYEIP